MAGQLCMGTNRKSLTPRGLWAQCSTEPFGGKPRKFYLSAICPVCGRLQKVNDDGSLAKHV